MKILIVTPYLGFSYGGPSKVLREIVRELNNLGLEADLISTNADGKDCLNIPLNTWIKDANYR